MYSEKKFEIVRNQVDRSNGKVSKSLLFASSSEMDIRNKLDEPAIFEIREELIVRNNETGAWDYAWRVIVNMQDVKVWD